MAISPTTLRLDAKLKKRIKKLADRAGESPHGYLLRVIQSSVERAESREEWLESGRAAQEEFEGTRMALDPDETFAWFQRVAKGEKAAPPKPRFVPRRQAAK